MHFSEKLIELYTEKKETVEFDEVTKSRITEKSIPKTCPKCDKQAKSWNELINKFGLRFTNGKHIPQSHCRECRKA